MEVESIGLYVALIVVFGAAAGCFGVPAGFSSLDCSLFLLLLPFLTGCSLLFWCLFGCILYIFVT
jgi:hypothetical protein